MRDELLSDLSDDDVQLATKTPEVRKHTVISFKHKDDTDLFGLGVQEEAPVAKDSSEEQEGNSLMTLQQEINLLSRGREVGKRMICSIYARGKISGH